TDTGCVDLPNVTIAKTAPATATATVNPGEFTTTYTVTVTNKGPATTYNLVDAFDFSATVQVVSGSATVSYGVGATSVAGYDGTSNTTLATAQAIAAGTPANPVVHTYLVTTVVKLDGNETPAQLSCADGGPDHGLYNLATLTVAGRPSTDDACSDVPTRSVSLVKSVSGVAGAYTWSFSFDISPLPNGQSGPKTINGTGPNTSEPISWTNLIPGLTYTVSEAAVGGWGQMLTCTGVDDSDDQTDNSVTFVAPTSDTAISCTATNTATTPTLKVVKTTVGGYGTFNFDVTNLTGGPIAVTTAAGTNPATSATRNLLTGTLYTVSEQADAAWTPGTLTCTVTPAGSQQAQAIDGTSFTAEPGAAYTCQITNTRKATVVVNKVVQGGDGSFGFSGSLPSLPSTIAATVGTPGTYTAANVTPGAYTVTEAAAPGWDLTSLVCDDGQSTVPSTVSGRTATINAEAGETVTCTFTNAKQGGITIVKDAVPNHAQDFSFTTTSTATTIDASFSLDDDAGAAGANDTLANSASFTSLSAGTYTFTEGQVAGWTLTAINCSGATATPNVGDRTVSIVLPAGGSATCTFVNTAATPTLTVTKTTVGGTGTFTFDVTGLTDADGLSVSTVAANPNTSAAQNLAVGTA
ncbi:MAG TPA: hypothetical protein PLV68_06290, partial [Ilumatobacteraceae bacterium]|nr:hypothetical protein [Ilumatobacteraceae bacterium]